MSVIPLSLGGGVGDSEEKPSVIALNTGECGRTVFEALTRAYLPRLYGFALRLTGERTAAEDLVQDTYVEAYQAFHQLVPGREVAYRLGVHRNTIGRWLAHYAAGGLDAMATLLQAYEAAALRALTGDTDLVEAIYTLSS